MKARYSNVSWEYVGIAFLAFSYKVIALKLMYEPVLAVLFLKSSNECKDKRDTC